MVQKKTGSGISTPANKRLPVSMFFLCIFPSFLPALRAAANAEDLDETMVSPVEVCKITKNHASWLSVIILKDNTHRYYYYYWYFWGSVFSSIKKKTNRLDKLISKTFSSSHDLWSVLAATDDIKLNKHSPCPQRTYTLIGLYKNMNIYKKRICCIMAMCIQPVKQHLESSKCCWIVLLKVIN